VRSEGADSAGRARYTEAEVYRPSLRRPGLSGAQLFDRFARLGFPRLPVTDLTDSNGYRIFWVLPKGVGSIVLRNTIDMDAKPDPFILNLRLSFAPRCTAGRLFGTGAGISIGCSSGRAVAFIGGISLVGAIKWQRTQPGAAPSHTDRSVLGLPFTLYDHCSPLKGGKNI
jgi:hypothetical protein